MPLRQFPPYLMNCYPDDFVPPADFAEFMRALHTHRRLFLMAPWGTGKSSLMSYLSVEPSLGSGRSLGLLLISYEHSNWPKITEGLRNRIERELQQNKTSIPESIACSPLHDQIRWAFAPVLENESVQTVFIDEAGVLGSKPNHEHIEFYKALADIFSEKNKYLIVASQWAVWDSPGNELSGKDFWLSYSKKIFDKRTRLGDIGFPYYLLMPTPFPEQYYIDASAAMNEDERLPPEIIRKVYRLCGYHKLMSGSLIGRMTNGERFLRDIKHSLPVPEREYTGHEDFCAFLLRNQDRLPRFLLCLAGHYIFSRTVESYEYIFSTDLPSSPELQTFTNIFLAAARGEGVEIPREEISYIMPHLTFPGWVQYEWNRSDPAYHEQDSLVYGMAPVLQTLIRDEPWYRDLCQKQGHAPAKNSWQP